MKLTIRKSLDKQGFPTAVIHSGKDQATREQAIDGFKSGEFEILVATDIAGRGIDIEGVAHVINYDMPKDIESYTHRIGRTGRAGKKGNAATFVTGEGIEENVLWDLKNMLEKCKQPVPPDLSRHKRRSLSFSRPGPPSRGLPPQDLDRPPRRSRHP